jgi:7-keto-8-aminopelargonate synthetase-like enzyme
VPTILAAVGAALAMLQKQAAVETKVIEVKADQAVTNHQVARSIHVSEANAHAIASVAVQQAQALEQVSQQLAENTVKTEGIHDIVNSRDVELRTELAALHKELAAIKQANAVKKATTADGAV